MASRDEFLDLKSRNTKKISVYEKTNTKIDINTGAILEEQTEKIVKTSKEPDFIKVYYETVLAFNQINDIPVSFVMSLSRFISWSNEGQPMTVTLNKMHKEMMEKDCNVGRAQITRYIKMSVENGLIIRTQYRGVYEVNPFFIAKGKWDSIQKLQCKFNYTNGSWVREIDLPNGDENKND